MKKKTLYVLGLALLAGGLLATSGDQAWGDDGPSDALSGVWVYDVRVVRVDTTTPEITETSAPWEVTDGGPTVTTAWPVLLKQLKERGRTTLLVDQRVTAMAGTEAVVTQKRDRQIRMFQNQDLHNERWQSSTISTGCTAKLSMQAPGFLRYSVQVSWEMGPEDSDLRPLAGSTAWSGTYPALRGETLVLSYREQVVYADREPRGVEIHVFVTGRLVP